MLSWDRTLIIGERINPTGRGRLSEELVEGKLDFLVEEAVRQAQAGADAIDVNVGAPGVDEIELLPRAVSAVYKATELPVCADSSEPEALLAALKSAPELIVNSTTADRAFMDRLVPEVARAEAALIGITKDGAGIPPTAQARLELASSIVERATAEGITKDRLLIDFLTVPISTEPESAALTLECVARGKAELGVKSVLGASNISYGMPARNILNASFVSMAVFAGLSAAIVDPLEPGVAQAVLAADVLAGKDRMGRRFLADYRKRRR